MYTQPFTYNGVIVLPACNSNANGHEKCVESCFNRHMMVWGKPTVESVRASIQFCADMLHCSEAHIARCLTKLGLQAPPEAFPEEIVKQHRLSA